MNHFMDSMGITLKKFSRNMSNAHIFTIARKDESLNLVWVCKKLNTSVKFGYE